MNWNTTTLNDKLTLIHAAFAGMDRDSALRLAACTWSEIPAGVRDLLSNQKGA